MRRNVIWIAFIVIVALFAVWFIIRAGHSIFSYYQFSTQVPATIEKWSVEERKSDQFAVVAHFCFEYKSKNYPGVGRVGSFYPNPWAANRAQKQLSNQQWNAWINPRHPEQAVLEKKFPYKKAISAAVLMGLLLYFSILGIYMRLKYGK